MAIKNAQEVLLKSATDLFYKKGYSDTSIREVSAKAGVANSLLYHYFEDKEEMLFQIITTTTRDLLNILQEIDERIADPLDRLREKLLAHMILFGMKRGKESKIVVEENYWLRGKRKKANTNYEKAIFGMYMKDIKVLEASGRLNDINPTVLAFSLFGIINWFFRWYREDGPLSPEDVAANIIRFMFEGMLKNEQAPKEGVIHE